MKSFIIVKKGTSQIETRYKNKGSLYDGNIDSDPHFEVPSNMDVDTVRVTFENNIPIFSIDDGQVAQKHNEKLQHIRKVRNQLLQESDWTRLDDVKLSESQREAWKIYRQQLRDLLSIVDLNNIVWPTPPQ